MTRGRKPTDEEKALWHKVMQDVCPLSAKKIVLTAPQPRMASVRKKIEERHYKESYENIARPRGGSITSKLMPTGKVHLDGRIDLHGMTLMQAEDQLKRYLLHAQSNCKRWILVITGKGAPDNLDSLRYTVPRWLNQWSIISGYRVAKPKDGGDGALYVWIRVAPI